MIQERGSAAPAWVHSVAKCLSQYANKKVTLYATLRDL